MRVLSQMERMLNKNGLGTADSMNDNKDGSEFLKSEKDTPSHPLSARLKTPRAEGNTSRDDKKKQNTPHNADTHINARLQKDICLLVTNKTHKVLQL